MITPLSYPVWKIITPLQKIQFPLRFMSVVMMCGVIITAAAVHFLAKGNLFRNRAWLYASMLFIASLLVIDGVYIFDPGAFVSIDRAKFESDLRELPDRENQPFWWSVWSKEEAFKIKEKVLAESRAASISEWKPEQRNFTVEAGTPENARIATFYYPHWKAEVNGNPVAVEQDENGAMLIPLPAEKSGVRLYFQEPLKIKIASLISIFSWLFILASFFLLLQKKFAVSKTHYSKLTTEEFTY